ncbi:hypothetical protein MSMEI_5411 [Mycolicibacterium smegmatis MC2 155]|uniref:Uncharacterized protein n=1 Tax=Mycolicibacterium smegmatis (strain ATCC 700084 / mc(2)155) TaxID=246196 RepID=I7G851_MYCS2|nr:hypothetical protein MSMEI_5411 [Mycolicibacterium smegmatis MC2 155]
MVGPGAPASLGQLHGVDLGVRPLAEHAAVAAMRSAVPR